MCGLHSYPQMCVYCLVPSLVFVQPSWSPAVETTGPGKRTETIRLMDNIVGPLLALSQYLSFLLVKALRALVTQGDDVI